MTKPEIHVSPVTNTDYNGVSRVCVKTIALLPFAGMPREEIPGACPFAFVTTLS